MDGKVTWMNNLAFEAVGRSGKPIIFDSAPISEMQGPSPMEALALALAGCTAIDVMSILQKKRQVVTAFETLIHADRATEVPRVYTHATIEYRVTGRGVDEQAVIRSIQLSIDKYCPVHVMLSQSLPIDLTYVVLEDEGDGKSRVTAEGTFMPAEEA